MLIGVHTSTEENLETEMWILGVPFKMEWKRRTKERDVVLSGYITETTRIRAAPARAEQTWRAL